MFSWCRYQCHFVPPSSMIVIDFVHPIRQTFLQLAHSRSDNDYNFSPKWLPVTHLARSFTIWLNISNEWNSSSALFC